MPAAAGLRGLVLACVDARRGEVFAAVHEVAAPGIGARPTRLGAGLFAPEELVAALDEFAGAAGARAWATARSATPQRLRAVPGVDPATPGLGFPPPAALLGPRAGAAATRENRQSGRSAVVPLYMREADATSNFARAARA